MGSSDEKPIRETAFLKREHEELTIVEQVVSPAQLREALRRRRAVSTLKLGARLIELGLITQAQLDAGLEMKDREPGKHLGEILLDLGFISANHLQQVLCEKLGIPLVDLEHFEFDQKILDLLPADLVRETGVMPLCRVDGNKLVVASSDPLDPEPLDRVRFYVQTQVVPAFAPREQIAHALTSRYGIAFGVAAAVSGIDQVAMAGATNRWARGARRFGRETREQHSRARLHLGRD